MVNLNDKAIKMSRSYLRSIFPDKFNKEIFCVGNDLDSDITKNCNISMLLRHV